jgi:hypothetical protein
MREPNACVRLAGCPPWFLVLLLVTCASAAAFSAALVHTSVYFLPVQLLEAAGALQSAAAVPYAGPVLALCGVALKQWANYRQASAEAQKLLKSVRDLLQDMHTAWDDLTMRQERMQGWIVELAAAASHCVEVHTSRAGGVLGCVSG